MSLGRVQSLQVVGDGPNGAVILTLDENGLKDSNNRLLYAPFMLTWPALAASVSSYVWTCHEGVWKLMGARSIISVTGGASAAVMPRVCAGVTAIASGVAQLTAVLDLQETPPNRQNGVMIASPTEIYPGDSLALEFSGTIGTPVGVVTLLLQRTQ